MGHTTRLHHEHRWSERPLRDVRAWPHSLEHTVHLCVLKMPSTQWCLAGCPVVSAVLITGDPRRACFAHTFRFARAMIALDGLKSYRVHDTWHGTRAVRSAHFSCTASLHTGQKRGELMRGCEETCMGVAWLIPAHLRLSRNPRRRSQTWQYAFESE